MLWCRDSVGGDVEEREEVAEKSLKESPQKAAAAPAVHRGRVWGGGVGVLGGPNT